jgi:hypothetical protein
MAGIDRSCVLVLDLDEARCAASAAASLDMPVAILSVRDGALTAGIGWFDAVMRAARRHEPAADLTGILDCGDRADLVQMAWHQGIEAAVYRGPAKVADRLVGIARRSGRILLRRRPRAIEIGQPADSAGLAARLQRVRRAS